MFTDCPGIFIFDLDGTLVDSLGDIQLAANQTREANGIPPLSIDEVSPLIGLPAAELFHCSSSIESVSDISILVAQFRDRLAQVTGTHSTVFPCVRNVLTYLKEREWHLAVATNKPTALAELVLGRMHLLEFFNGVFGADELPPKPHPAIIQSALGDTTWASMFMVGDTTMDIRAGRAAGAQTVAIATGSESLFKLNQAGPDLILKSMCELADHLQ